MKGRGKTRGTDQEGDELLNEEKLQFYPHFTL